MKTRGGEASGHRRWIGKAVAGALAVGAAGIGAAWIVSEGVGGRLEDRGQITSTPLPRTAIERRDSTGNRILFGDLHVHTTFSSDAFVFSLPLFQGEGAHPPADACDFARFCAELDFWSINDHAEHLTPRQWRETREAIRECNAVSGDPANPDLVSFLGWEWTQSSPAEGFGGTGRAHYGHKNVILLDTEEGSVPVRPIGAGSGGLFESATEQLAGAAGVLVRAGLALQDVSRLRTTLDFNRTLREIRELDLCPEGVAVRDLPPDCLEGADTPEALFEKLDDWGFPSLVIPHGTSWGVHAPPGADLALQLGPQHDAERQRLFEVYSGHGASERWLPLRDVLPGPTGALECAPPDGAYVPCCWRAGEIVALRCEASASECERRAAEARLRYLAEGPVSLSDAEPDDWLECGQLANDFLPAFDYRPGMSAQYGLAVRRGDEALRFGLIASSDNHKARAGSGYKERARKAYGDAYGLSDGARRVLPEALLRLDPGSERNASYYYTAGLVAVHAKGRDRRSIFEALRARHTYGTSGPRILLWFEADSASMGSVLRAETSPRFRVRALGARVQQPGCPEHTKERLSAERLARLCLDECHHPSDERHAIERIEVVRIRPQRTPDEPLELLIEDPWRSFSCADAGDGCEVVFHDEAYDAGREHLYYVRALQHPTPAVNGDPMRCERDASGRCVAARSCPASGADFVPGDDCLFPVQERAWSSPIWLLPEPVVASATRSPTPP